MAIKKKSQEQATISGKATTIAAPLQNPALQKLVPAHLRVHRGGRGGAQRAAKKNRVVDPAPDAKKKEETNKDGDDDKKYLNFLDDVAALGAFKE